MSKKLQIIFFLVVTLLLNGKVLAIDENPLTTTGYNELKGNYIGELQPVLSEQPAWKAFAAQSGWSALFEQRNGLPSRAFGPPLELRAANSSAESAELFLADQLEAFGMSHIRFVKESDISSSKYQYLKYRQQYNGVEVLHSDIDARLNKAGRLVMFGLDVYDNIQVSTQPSISPDNVNTLINQKYGTGINSILIEPSVKILPKEKNGLYEYKLVYVVKLHGDNDKGHFEYQVLVDAHSGEIVEERNLICTLDLNVKGSVTNNPAVTKVVNSLPYIKVRYNGANYFADENGKVALPDFTGDAIVKVYMEGKYAKVVDGSVKNFDITVNSSNPNISLDGIATDVNISAYYNVTAQHLFMKEKLPSFTGLDGVVAANVNLTSSTCNAFYSPLVKQVNFFKEGGGCKNSALFSDVIFHEYGHGINYEYSASLGGDMQNGSLQEGYADVWAFLHTDDPVIANGFGHPDTTPYIRRYDEEPKVYPSDMVGEVHWDGEIIAGAWWDLRQSAGRSTMQNIFLETLLTKPDQVAGQEGKLYTQILLDALLADDSDGDLSNGTPNSQKIIDAFARHGITLFTSLTVVHDESVIKDSLTNIDLTATLSGLFNTSMITGKTLYYKKRGTPTWLSVPASISASTLSGTIPGQAAGSIIDYYFKLNFINGQTLYCPTYVNQAGVPEFPFNALVSFKRKTFEDFDNSVTPGWSVQADAFKGNWALLKTVGSKLSLTVNYTWSRDVQIGYDNTPGSTTSKCYITGNGTLTDNAGINDVDSGRTTLKSPIYDVSSYTDPVFSYYRFYTCDRGANPGTDSFKVYLTNNDGGPVLVEKTVFTDWKWRRNVIRLKDYFPNPGNVRATFVADDLYNPAIDNGGGSLVEAGVDDVAFYDVDRVVLSGIQETLVDAGYTLFPNPSSDKLFFQITEPGLQILNYKVYDSKGAVVRAIEGVNMGKEIEISINDLTEGTYFLFFETSKGKSSARFVKSN